MSNHAKFSLAVVLIGSVLLAVGCRDDLTFHNPVDPDNPDSPFYEPVIATSGVGAHDNSSGVAVQDVSFGWNPVASAEEYEFQLATDSAFSETATIEQVPTTDTEVGPYSLSTDHTYHWRARFLASVPFEQGSQAVWGPWHEFELEFVVPEAPQQENAFYATGVIRGVPVELSGAVPSAEIGSDEDIWLELDSTAPESIGSRVAFGFRPRGLSPGLYTMPAVGRSGIRAYVGSDLIEAAEGYYANVVDDDSRILVSEIEQRAGGQTRIAGTFDLDTNIDDTLSGGFNVVVDGYNYGDGNSGNPIDGGTATSRTITVDGDPGDWDGVESVIVEQTGDSLYPDPSGDITRVSVAADATYLYFMMEIAGGVLHTEGDFEYRVWIQDADAEGGTNAIEIGVTYDGITSSGYAFSRETGEWQPISGFQSSWAAAGSVLEFQIDRTMIHFPAPITVRGHLQRNTLEEDPDRTPYWRFSLP
ncbi:MAG TPA: hypothetical protein VJ932_11945 [Alkalispirochaeta sp.]|nr:hypothetical protein [Alkalispirochaeta sp.]